jgi:four helix bundle protein
MERLAMRNALRSCIPGLFIETELARGKQDGQFEFRRKWWEMLVTLQFVTSDFVLRHPIYSRAAGSLPFPLQILDRKLHNEDMTEYELKLRTKRFALEIIKFWESLPKDDTCKTLGRQLLRAGTSVAANYRAVCRAKSKPDFISKFGTVLEEADESAFWIELLVDSGKVPADKAKLLLKEANELLAIAISSINTARKNQ